MKKSQLRKIIRESIKGLMNEQGCPTVPYNEQGCNVPLQTNTNSCMNTWGQIPCVQQWGPGRGTTTETINQTNQGPWWFANWVLPKQCGDYDWAANKLVNQAQSIINNQLLATNIQPTITTFNNWGDIRNAANEAFGAHPHSASNQPNKFKFKKKMVLGKYAQCMKQSCGC